MDASLEGVKRAESEIVTYGIEIDKYFFDQNDKRSFLEATGEILEKKYHVVLLAPMFLEESIDFINQCAKRTTPCVFINSDLLNTSSLCYIGPDLFHAGTLAAHLYGHLIGKEGNILIVNISEIDNHRHFLRKEQGFKEHFIKNQKLHNILRLDIKDTNYDAVKKRT